ncbi:hypothetical protein KJ708_08355 [bacterium]|nr:hypothetical protein [bacterium]MBU1917941.1 hypothetical protein [bacterium]
MSPQYFQAAFTALAPTVHIDHPNSSFVEGLKSQERILADHACITERPLGSYLNHHPLAGPALKYLRAENHWLDSGAGHAVAMRDFAKQRLKRTARLFGQKLPKMTALSLGKPECRHLEEDLKRIPQLQYVETCIMQRDPRELSSQSVDLLTDIMGALTYSLDLRAVLMQYGDLLTHGAEVYTTVQVGYIKRFQIINPETGSYEYPEEFFQNLFILDPEGNEITLKEFLQMTTGFVLYDFKQDMLANYPTNAHFCLLRNDDPVYVPELRFIKERFIPGAPPRRVFQLVSTKTNA